MIGPPAPPGEEDTTHDQPPSTTSTPEPGGSIDAATLAARSTDDSDARSDGPMVLDVRSAAEYEAAHIRGSYHVPLATLAEHTSDLAAHLDTPVVLVCQSGVRAEQARRHLAAVGLDRAHVLDGGAARLHRRRRRRRHRPQSLGPGTPGPPRRRDPRRPRARRRPPRLAQGAAARRRDRCRADVLRAHRHLRHGRRARPATDQPRDHRTGHRRHPRRPPGQTTEYSSGEPARGGVRAGPRCPARPGRRRWRHPRRPRPGLRTRSPARLRGAGIAGGDRARLGRRRRPPRPPRGQLAPRHRHRRCRYPHLHRRRGGQPPARRPMAHARVRRDHGPRRPAHAARQRRDRRGLRTARRRSRLAPLPTPRHRRRAARRVPHRPARRRRRVPARTRPHRRARPAHPHRSGHLAGHHRHQRRRRARALPRRREQRQRSRAGLVDHRPVRRRRDPHLATRQRARPPASCRHPAHADSPSWS